MNISDKGPLHDLAGLLAGLQDVTSVKSQAHQVLRTQDTGDQVRISTRAKEFQKAYELIAQAPDVRVEKVAQLQESINNGTYNVRGEQVADKLITHTILDAIL
jgi:negative regulator of flagellin synthesis FlgM